MAIALRKGVPLLVMGGASRELVSKSVRRCRFYIPYIPWLGPSVVFAPTVPEGLAWISLLKALLARYVFEPYRIELYLSRISEVNL